MSPVEPISPSGTATPSSSEQARASRLGRWSRWLWGDAVLRDKIIRAGLKITLAFVLAYAVHEAASRLSTRVWDLESIVEIETKVNDELKAALNDDSWQVCFLIPGRPSSGCSDAYGGSSYLGFVLVNKKQNFQSSPEWFFRVTNPFWLASTPALEHSIDSFLREIERYAFNKSSESITDLQLCVGTRKPLEDSKCKATSKIAKKMRVEAFEGLMDRVRKSAMIFGNVQLLSLVVFLVIAIEVAGLYLVHVYPKPILFKIIRGQGLERISALKSDEFEVKLEELGGRPDTSIGDRLYGWVMFNRINSHYSKNYPSTSIAEGFGNFHDFRNVLTEIAETHISGLEKTAENILKLSFAGTIIGIGTSLFAARNLDTADPTFKLLVKSEMFAGIGVAFGTTLVGVLLSIFAAVLLRRFSFAWTEEINRHHELMIEGIQFYPESAFPSFPPYSVDHPLVPPDGPDRGKSTERSADPKAAEKAKKIQESLTKIVGPTPQEENSLSYRVGSIMFVLFLVALAALYQTNLAYGFEKLVSFFGSFR